MSYSLWNEREIGITLSYCRLNHWRRDRELNNFWIYSGWRHRTWKKLTRNSMQQKWDLCMYKALSSDASHARIRTALTWTGDDVTKPEMMNSFHIAYWSMSKDLSIDTSHAGMRTTLTLTGNDDMEREPETREIVPYNSVGVWRFIRTPKPTESR